MFDILLLRRVAAVIFAIIGSYFGLVVTSVARPFSRYDDANDWKLCMLIAFELRLLER